MCTRGREYKIKQEDSRKDETWELWTTDMTPPLKYSTIHFLYADGLKKILYISLTTSDIFFQKEVLPNFSEDWRYSSTTIAMSNFKDSMRKFYMLIKYISYAKNDTLFKQSKDVIKTQNHETVSYVISLVINKVSDCVFH